MENKSSSSPSRGQDEYNNSIIILIGLLLLGWMARPWYLKVIDFWKAHHIQIILVLLFIVASLIVIVSIHFRNKFTRYQAKRAITEEDESSIYLGESLPDQIPRHMKEEFRPAHTQIIGTTNAGKTASTILPWSVQDIEQGRGLIIIDGKADQGFLSKLYSYAVKHNRQGDFKVFSLANPAISSTYNPFCGGTAEQITEKAFSAFNIKDPYYGPIQFSALRTMIALLMRRGETPMPGVIRELLRNKALLAGWLTDLQDEPLAKEITVMLEDNNDEFQKKYSGLVTALGHFSLGSTSALYNTSKPEIDLLDVTRRKQICYFQLPTMQFPFLGEATGKLILQNLQSVVSGLQVNSTSTNPFFSVYLDDFNDYIYPGFASLLNKSRSANVGVVFSHQSLGDLDKVGPEFKQIVLTCTNIKVIMRSNDPATAEHFSKMIGTQSTEKTTERRSKTFFGPKNTGEQSVRETEEYRFHPNVFKSDLKRGEGVVVLPHQDGTEIFKMKFSTAPELPAFSLPIRDLPQPNLIKEATYKGLIQSSSSKVNQVTPKGDSPSIIDRLNESSKGDEGDHK